MGNVLGALDPTQLTVLVVAAVLTLAASAAVHTFTNSFGYWSDSSNWDTGIVPNGPGETAVLKGGYVTNDVDGLTVVKIDEPQRRDAALRQAGDHCRQHNLHGKESAFLLSRLRHKRHREAGCLERVFPFHQQLPLVFRGQ